MKRKIWVVLLLAVISARYVSHISAVFVPCSSDINQDGSVNLSDYSILVQNFLRSPLINPRADLNSDGVVDLTDYSLLVSQFLITCPVNSTPTVTPIVSSNPTVTSTKSPTKTPTFTPTRTPTKIPTVFPTSTPILSPSVTAPPVGVSQGIWISPQEIAALPMSGGAWDRLLSTANSNWGTAHLDDNNSNHDVDTLAGALVAVRTGDTAMRNKTIAGLQSAMVSPLARALELSRGLQTYIIAADIIGYHDPAFEAWVRKMVNVNVSPHTGGSVLCNPSGSSYSCSGVGGVMCTAERSANNWGGHARASIAAAAMYLNDAQMKTEVTNAYKAFIGLAVPNHLYCTTTNWHPNQSNRVGVNPLNSSIQGHDVSGVLPEDWRRGSEFKWPPTLSGYMWEGMQGYVVTAVILHRAGLVPFNSADNAVVRSTNQLYNGINYPASSDDTWIPWVVNHYGGSHFPTTAANPGKNMGWTDWTLAN